MSVNNTASQDKPTLGVCDEEQLEEYQGMYVLFAEKENLDEVVKEAAEETLNAEQKNETPVYKSVKLKNTASQINTTLGVCDETQLKECQGMYVLVAEKENMDEVVKEAVKETLNAGQKIQTPLHKSVKLKNTASQINTALGVCDEAQRKGMDVKYNTCSASRVQKHQHQQENLDEVVKEAVKETLNAGQKIQTPLHKSVKLKNTASQINTALGVCDEAQRKEYQAMYVLVAEKENLDEVVKEVAEKTLNAEQKIQTSFHKSIKREKKSKKYAKNDFMLKWAQKEKEKLELEIKFMKEEHKLKMEKLKLEMERISAS